MLRISFASRHGVIITTTEAYRFRQLRGKRNRRPYATTTTTVLPETDSNDDNADKLETETTDVDNINVEEEHEHAAEEHQTEIYENNSSNSNNNNKNESNDDDNDGNKQEEIEESSDSPDTITQPIDPVVGRLMSTISSDPLTKSQSHEDVIKEQRSRTEDIPDITSLFTGNPAIKSRTDTVFAGLETHEIRSLQRASQQSPTYDKAASQPENSLEESKTIGPYDSDQDYANDAPDHSNSPTSGDTSKDQEEDSSTILPDAEPAYRYNIKVRSNGKVLDPPSK
ncbi:myb-like protein P isoform X2 [Microplitis mediator]|uniref:myb-like protein P isoform X2 n=1 Tax=Microplitis mediator TaxID=375433 RepID=UPI002552F861|nr:myb-like protein P isoform X2 [Microplitis mediator]